MRDCTVAFHALKEHLKLKLLKIEIEMTQTQTLKRLLLSSCSGRL